MRDRPYPATVGIHPSAGSAGWIGRDVIRLPEIGPGATADEIAAAWLLGYSESTRRAYAGDLRSWAAWLAQTDVAPLDARRIHVDAYVRELEASGASPATIARRLSALAGFYGYALDEGALQRSPVARVRRPKVADESPRLGIDRPGLLPLLDAAATSSPRDHALTCLLVLNGLRISEALNADVGDLADERGHRILRIVRKGGKRGATVLAPRTAAAIDELTLDRRQGPIFVTGSGARMDRHAAWKVVRRLARLAGIEHPVSPHTLRHSFVTAALDAGASLRDVQDAAGHADPRTTRRYDRGRHNLDRHPTYAVAAALAK